MKVNITKRIATLKGRRYFPVVVDSNGCVQADWVVVNGRQEKHLKGTYYLDWSAYGKRQRISVGADAAIAGRRLIRRQRELNAGIRSGCHSTQVGSRLRICSAIDDFLEDIQLSRQRKTWIGYQLSLRYFQESCKKKFLVEIKRKDLLPFIAFLRNTKKLSRRTVHNKFADVLAFLRLQGVPKLIGKHDRPRFVTQEVSIYEEEELSNLHTVCSSPHSALYDFLLMSGFRVQEAMHTLWSDIRFNTNTIEMRWKPQFDWTPKAYKEREVPVPNELLEVLANHRRSLPEVRASANALVFSTATGERDTHMLRSLKQNAARANLNTDDFWLHKFRATFATTHLRAGIDLMTVMTWMGQTNLKSIIRYLKPARHKTAIARVNLSFTGYSRTMRKGLNLNSL